MVIGAALASRQKASCMRAARAKLNMVIVNGVGSSGRITMNVRMGCYTCAVVVKER